MADQEKVVGTSPTSFSEAAQDAGHKIVELRYDESVTFNMTQASVTIGGLAGATVYDVTLERADK